MIDLTGKRFGRLVVVDRCGSSKNKSVTWLCKCDCGNTKVVNGLYLRNGETRSCGCLSKEIVSALMSKHRQSKTRLYRVWAGIKNRCYNEKATNYKYYGGRGIEMCDIWKSDFESFYEWSFENGYDPNAKRNGCSLDRIDNNGPYSPDNCRWVSHIEQCNNQKSNVRIEYDGETHTMAEWSRIKNIKYSTLKARLYKGIPFETAIEQTHTT